MTATSGSRLRGVGAEPEVGGRPPSYISQLNIIMPSARIHVDGPQGMCQGVTCVRGAVRRPRILGVGQDAHFPIIVEEVHLRSSLR